MFDLEAFDRMVASFLSAESGSANEHEAVTFVAFEAVDAIAEIRRLRAEVATLRVERGQAATVRHVWGVCEDVEAP